jgi:predicted phosphodiesterase
MSCLQTVGLIGDVHCEHESLAAAIELLKAEHVDAVVCTGDIPTGPGNFNACCELLRDEAILTVRGNHDRWLLRGDLLSLPDATAPSAISKGSWKVLESLPVTRELVTVAGTALLCHGLGRYDMEGILPDQSDDSVAENDCLQGLSDEKRWRFVLNGHSHRRMVRRCGSLTIVNAGTLRRDHQPCVTIIDFAARRVQYFNVVGLTRIVPGEEVDLL